MKQIKIRAWDKQNKCMKVVTEINFMYEKSQKMTWGMQGSLTDVWLNEENMSYIHSDVIFLQFTGLKDANLGHDKREIYESDIIEWYADNSRTMKRRGVVRFIDGSFVVVFADNLRLYLTKIIEWGGVVIGNEFENPELMEVEG